MTDRGFGPGGPGIAPDGSVTFLYCTGANAFASRWPKTIEILRMRTGVDLGEPSRCLDLVVEASSKGDIERLEFEFVGVADLLAAANLDHLARPCSVDELRDLSATDSATRIREAVAALMPLGPET